MSHLDCLACKATLGPGSSHPRPQGGRVSRGLPGLPGRPGRPNIQNGTTSGVSTPSGRWPAGDPILNLPQQRSSSQGNIGAHKFAPWPQGEGRGPPLFGRVSWGPPRPPRHPKLHGFHGASPPSGRRPSQILRTILKRDGGALMVSPVWLETVEIHSMLKISRSKMNERCT